MPAIDSEVFSYLVVYEEAKDEDKKPEGAEDVRIPPDLKENQVQHLSS